MADRLDVAARLAEGRLAVERTQTYVRACHVLGYHDPDLTAHGSQVCDWYDAEVGLDLRVLDHDIAELWAVVNASEEALNVQRTQLDELAAAWRGPGADSAARFLRRHCDTAAAVAAHVRTAAERCAALRDELWQFVDGKAATAIAIDDRRVADRPAWLAAAHMVTTGAGDQSAEELVRQQINPYVDNDVRLDWLTAMRSTTASVAAAYEEVTGALTHVAEVCFEIPGELGPSWQPVVDEPVAASTPLDAVPTMPAAVSGPLPPTTVAPPALPVDPLAAMPPVPPELAAPLGDAAGLPTGAGTLGGSGGLGGLAGNIGGVVGKIVDGIGGLIGSLADGFGDLSGPGDPLDADDSDELDEPDEPDDDDVEHDDEDVEHDDEEDEPDAGADDATSETTDENSPPAEDAADEPAVQEAIPPPPDSPPPAAPAPVPPPPADPSASTPESAAEGSTPCEIAADELPQAGQ